MKGELPEEFKERKSLEQTKQKVESPSSRDSGSMIDKDMLWKCFIFYNVFYMLPLIYLPYMVGHKEYDYLVYTGLYVAQENVQIPNYKPQLPTAYSIFAGYDRNSSPMNVQLLYFLVWPLTWLFKLVKLKDIVITFAKIDFAYLIALVAVNRFMEIIKVISK